MFFSVGRNDDPRPSWEGRGLHWSHFGAMSRHRVALAALTVTLAAGAGAAVLGADSARSSGTSAQSVIDELLPRPQSVVDKHATVHIDESWQIVLATSEPGFAFAGQWFNDKLDTDQQLQLEIVDGNATEPRGRRIVLGNPDRHGFVRDAMLHRWRALPDAVGDEGYLLEVFTADQDALADAEPEILIAANTAQGAFYGVVTLLQLIGADASVPAVRIVDYPEHELRGSYAPYNIRMEWKDGRYYFTDSQRAFIDWLAGHKFNTVFTVENGAFFKDEEAWLQAYQELFAYARQRFIEPVPRICSISSVSPFEFEFFEGWYIQDEPFVFGAPGVGGDPDVAVPVHPFEDVAVNGSFERDSDGDGVPDGWSVTQREGATWTIDETVASDGRRSMRLDIPEPAPDSNSATLRTTISDVVPDSIYCLWSKAKASDIEDVKPQLTMYARDEAGHSLGGQSDTTWSVSRWRGFGTCIKTPSETKSITIYSRIQYPGTGTFWLDDVQLYRVDGGLRNIIRANDTDIVVTDVSGSTRYELGTDYEVEDGETSIRFVPTLEPFVVRRLPTGSIPADGEVRLSYDAYLFTKASGYWSSAPCVARDELYTQYYYPAIDRLLEHLQPKIMNIDADEIRGFYRDSRMQRAFDSPGGAIAYWANRIEDYLADRCPECRLWIWDDMVSPYHNGGVERYQVPYGGLPGRMAEATERDWMPTSIIMDIWWYGDTWISQMWHSMEYFGAKGYDYFGSPWQDEENIISWSEMLMGRPHALGGVETNWRAASFEESHEEFADHFWNTRDKVLLFDSFERDSDGDGVPDGWRVAGSIDYSTDGTASYGKRIAGFPAGAVRVTNGTVLVQSDRIGVRPNTDYVLSTYLRCDGRCTPPRLIAAFYDATGRLLGEQAEPVDAVTQEYEKHEAMFKSPPAAATASVWLDPAAPGVWYDVVRFKEATHFLGIVGPYELPPATFGEPYRAQLLADAEVGPQTWSVAAGELPPGLALSAEGWISGTPSGFGSHEFTVVVIDSTLVSDSRRYVVDVTPSDSGSSILVPIAMK